MPYNDVVQKFIDRYSGKLPQLCELYAGRRQFLYANLRGGLEAYNLPLELKYLPVIESALNPTAVSRVGATGLWQFMIGTGKRYGLETNSLIDERRDPVKSSYAAAHYLSDLYKIFDDWSPVAHNCGPDKVNKAIHRAKGSADYWNIILPPQGDTRICASLHRNQLHHELLLRPQHLSYGDRAAS